MQKKGTFLVILVFCLFINGCATQKIIYRIDNIPKVTNSIFKNNTLAVKEFKDETEKKSIKTAWYKEKRIIVKDKKKWYFNHNDCYKNKEISCGITKMTVKHLAASGLFQSVTLSDTKNLQTDYILEGIIHKFEGFKRQNDVALIGSQCGLLGALMTAGVKSEYTATTMLIGVKLIETTENKTVWEGDVKATIEGEDYADAYGWSAYIKANLALKEAVNELIRKIQNEI